MNNLAALVWSQDLPSSPLSLSFNPGEDIFHLASGEFIRFQNFKMSLAHCPMCLLRLLQLIVIVVITVITIIVLINIIKNSTKKIQNSILAQKATY